MKVWHRFLNRIVAAILPIFLLSQPLHAQTPQLDALLDQLAAADAQEAVRIEAEIQREWSLSGSPSMDLLLERGRQALADGEPEIALEHLSALVDHAPDFAEGWNARATAYYQLGELGPALSDIARVLTLNPRHFGALSGLGQIFEDIGRPDQALEAYRAALAIHPHLAGVTEAIARLEAAAAGQDL